MNILAMPSKQRERTMLLMVRMWLESSEPAGFRARINEIPDLELTVERTAVFGDVDGAIEHVAGRVRAFACGDFET